MRITVSIMPWPARPQLVEVTYTPTLLERMLARFHEPTRELLASHRQPRWAERGPVLWAWSDTGRIVDHQTIDAIEGELRGGDR